MHEAGVAGDAALARRTNEIRVELRSRETVAPFGQGLQTAVAARRVSEGHDGRGVKKASRRQVLLLHLEAPANFSATRMGPEKSQQPRQATFLIGGQGAKASWTLSSLTSDTSKHIILVSIVVNHQM
jgi:hypothetical protein